MKYTIELKLAGLAKNVTNRPELFFVYGDAEIEHLCEFIGWDQLDEPYPTAMWAEVDEGDYGDIFCTFSSMPSSLYNTVYKVIRKYESVLGPDYDQPAWAVRASRIITSHKYGNPIGLPKNEVRALASLITKCHNDQPAVALGHPVPDLDPLRDSLRPILDQVDGTRDELHAMCQVDNSLALANFYRELTVVADGIYGFIYGKDRD